MGFASQALNCRADQKLYHLQVFQIFTFVVICFFDVYGLNTEPSFIELASSLLKLIELLLPLNALPTLDVK